MFDSISERYDLLNGVLSMGVDKFWRKVMVKRVAAQRPTAVLDIATGTGDSAIALKKSGARHIVGIDISEQMLEVARKKTAAAGIAFIKADGEMLPFESASFDAATIAFGIRNFENRKQGLREMHRVLNSKGVLVVLELSLPQSALLRGMYKFYFYGLLPLVGRMVSRNSYAYRYLPNSVGEFPRQETFVAELKEAGFSEVAARPLTFGLSTIFEAKK